MITPEERAAIKKGFENIYAGATQLLAVCNLFEDKQHIIKKIVSDRFSTEIQTFEVNLNKFIDSKNKIVLIENDYVSIPPIESEITEHFKTFLFSEVVLFNPAQQHLFQPNIVEQIIRFINRQNDTATNIVADDNNTITYIKDIPAQYLYYIDLFRDKFTKIHIFNQLKNIKGNIVMIGANGSGKSTFARQLNGKIANNIVILSAQHLLFYSQNSNISATGTEIQEVRNFQLDSKSSNDASFSNLLLSDMNKLVNALISEHIDCTVQYYDDNQKETSYLSRTINLWKLIIEHRALKTSRTGIFVQGENIDSYLFNQLSDGEKTVFYYIGHILLARENSYIIVDEPENHLHLAICNKLWDCLEQERTDCKFVYLTHNLDFATTRTDSTILWNKSFVPPAQWDFEILPSMDTLPEVLVMELVGSRKNICFCEGDTKSSLDYRLYSILFPEYTIIPVSGHRNVIDYTDAYNKNRSFVTKAIGIIDGDCHLPEQIEKWEKKKIFVLKINEIENLLCDPIILTAAANRFCTDKKEVDKFYSGFWKLYESEKEKQAVWFVNNCINAKFKDNYLVEKNSIESLKTELSRITSPSTAESIYTERLALIESIIEKQSYEEALHIVNFKTRLTRELAKNIVDKYENRVLDLIKKNNTLKDAIIKKYFLGLKDLE
ncbi:ABC-type cobalamin/Fe3+-siderophores transport system, ATPase component [Propionispira arboris]|uniref:ABC-type cobalamin/Fe3+-siderophores transport system, ATPase component n=1 Tax=Propionispira arboris TaxID=84035 RepID=A0A1H6YNM1_9FIRM|nr:AAA family ATPase [Propionispira arboris]SEJ42908.1 ABC-type cobalamin/Fe3+-siderophores transport system, ATPase component [Propionispira arboris]